MSALKGVQLIEFTQSKWGISPWLDTADYQSSYWVFDARHMCVQIDLLFEANVYNMEIRAIEKVCQAILGDFNMDELPPEQIAVLRKAFEAFDSQKSGSIPCDMVADILRIMGQPFDKKILEELIEEVDADKSGRLEFEEFVTLAAKFIVEEDDEAMQKELKEAFRLYDKEGNGYIPTSCLKEILRELDDQLTDRELDMMIEEIDSDGSGTVDFEEFMEMMTGEV